MRGDTVDDGDDLVAVGNVQSPGPGDLAPSGDLGGDGFGALQCDIGDGNVGALDGEHARGGAAHAVGSTRDQHRQSLDRAAEFL